MTYLGFVEKRTDDRYHVFFPDFNGEVSSAGSFADAVTMGYSALNQYAKEARAKGKGDPSLRPCKFGDIPETPSTNWRFHPNKNLIGVFIVEVE